MKVKLAGKNVIVSDNLDKQPKQMLLTRLEARLGGTAGLRRLWNALSLVLGRFSSSGLGFLTWLITARLYPTSEVGLASGVVSAMMLVVQFAMLGLNAAFVSLYPQHKDSPGRLINTSINMVSLASLAFGLVFLLLSSTVFHELSIVTASPVYILLFLSLVLTATLNTLADWISIGIRRNQQVISRNILFGLVAIAVVATFPLVLRHATSDAVVTAWMLAALAACILAMAQIKRSLGFSDYRLEIDWQLGKSLVKIGVQNYLLTLAERAPNWIIPIFVTELLSPTDNAHWYTLWMMAWVIYIIPISLSQTLFADIAHRPDSVHHSIRYTTRASLVLGSGAAVLALLLANFMLRLMGDDYADAGTIPLRILVLAVFPVIFIQTYYGVCRGQYRLKEAIIFGALNGVAGVGAAILAGVRYGLPGMATAWLAVQVLFGGWAYFRIARLRGFSQAALGEPLEAVP